MNPRSAFVGCPSVVWSSSGSAKNPRYARLLPSTRKSSESRTGPSSRTSSSPVSVFGDTGQRYRPRCFAWRAAPLGLADRHRPGRRRRRDPAPTATAHARCRRGRRGARRPRLPALWSSARRARAARQARHGRRRASGAPAAGSAGRSATGGARDRSRPARGPRRRGRGRHAPRRRWARAADREEGARAAPSSSPGARVPRQASSSTTQPLPTSSRSRPTSRINPAVVDADLVLVVSSAETVVHGGPGALLAACDAATIRRAAAARSLVQASREPVWELALAIEAAVASRVDLLGVSLVLDHPRLAGRFRGYPHEEAALEHVARSPFRRLYSLLPGAVRRSILSDQSRVARNDRRLRRHSVGRARGGTRSGGRAPRDAPRRAARRDRRRRPLGRRTRAPRVAQPDHVGQRRAGPRAPAVARRVPGPRRRDARPRPLADALVRPRDAESVPLALRHAARRRREPGGRRRDGGGHRPAGAPRVPRGARVPSVAPVRRLGGLSAGALAARQGDRRRQPRRDCRARARVRTRSLRVERTRHGARRRGWARARRHPARPAVRAALVGDGNPQRAKRTPRD